MSSRIIQFSLIAACALLLACTKNVIDTTAVPGDDGKVILTCGVQSPALTKAGGDDAVSSIHAIVFDEFGFLSEHAACTDLLSGQGADGRETTFKVALTGTSDYRRIHFIANHTPSSIPFGSESQIIGTLATTGGESAFWQCVEMPSGISDGESYPQLERIPMVRNTARISVVSDDPSFTILGYKVVNVPEGGSIAPWINGTGPFMGYGTTSNPNYDNINTAGYHGIVPTGMGELSSTPWGTAPVDVYEHPYTADRNTYTHVIVHGQLSGVTRDSYYKLDLIRTDNNGAAEYMDILRNIHYRITITAMGSAGYKTEAEAESHAAGNNISGSIDTEGLDEVSDGLSQFFLTATEFIIVDNEPVRLRYKFIPDAIASPDDEDNDAVTVDAPAGAVLASAASVATRDDSDGWRTVTLTPRTPEGIVYTQTIRLTTNNGLSKTVRLRLRPKYTLSVSVSPETVAQTIDTPVNISFTLPAGLPESIFPLKMIISSQKKTLYPNSDRNHLPVYIEDGNFGYQFNVEWSDYTGGVLTYTAYMLTNAVISATYATVANKYFETGSAQFNNADRYVTSFTIPAYGLTVTGLSTTYNSVYLYYDSARTTRVNNTTYRFYSYGLSTDTVISVNSMKTTDMIYFYNTSRRTIVGLTIEQIESGEGAIAFN